MRDCYNCAHRLNDGVEAATKDGVNDYYTCEVMSQREHAHIRVTLEHKACRDWKLREDKK